MDTYHSYVQIYTDTSRSWAGRLGVAFVIPKFNTKIAKRFMRGRQYTQGNVGNIVSGTMDKPPSKAIEPLRQKSERKAYKILLQHL